MYDLTIIIVLTFLTAALAVYGIYWFLVFSRQEQRIVNRRLALSKSVANPSAALEALREERGFGNINNPVLQWLSDWLSQTGIAIKQKTFLLTFLLLYLAVNVPVSIVLGFGFGSTALALVAAVGIMLFVLYRLRSRRIFNFAEQLPDAVDIITRGVRAGLPFSGAIAFGLDLRSALDNLYRRVGQEDLLFLTVAVSIQTQTGGNLGEILSRLSKLMRSRSKMRLKVNALSAEGRLSAIALTVLPFALFVIINVLSPAYYSVVRGSPILEPAIYVGLFLLLVGNVVMYRMVHFKY
jgi:tight adherence protein B